MSGIANQLKPYLPDIRAIHKSLLIVRTMNGCKQMLGSPTKHKDALCVVDLARAVAAYPTLTYDDKLFLALLHAGFFGLHRLGELVDSDSVWDCSPQKTIKRASLKVTNEAITYILPGSKADTLFEGNTVMFPRTIKGSTDPYTVILTYVHAHNGKVYGLCPQLWLNAVSHVPTCSWFLSRLYKLFSTPYRCLGPETLDIKGH
ncbi:unnamed protein product [Peniophora sp. CBMAI 1063]|nr:unnamed protein product [Peniophora sp. CBMAI 1063]